ncbi:carbonic anhydrase 1-like [Odontomachus brunneus]|uniref:carbonic anhydrase 1-like n=1 Tax=Odontomachus brunneus TaxID=486640 RepID=UPI0013F186C2|nr:carbonic anhydrase 1-like [Odontomachus brunneus]
MIPMVLPHIDEQLDMNFAQIEVNVYERNKENVQLIQQLANIEDILESPIDLNISYMKVIELNPLLWYNYNVMPKKLKLTNTGYTVILSGKWEAERPYLRDGPFASNYVFSQIHFHWGETNMDGSEHYVDGGSMPMELHAVHFKSDYETQEAALRRDDGVVILVYLFELQADHNPLLDGILRALPLVQAAYSSVRLTPFLITNIMRCFQRDYFVYWGSVKMISYRNSVLWVISREPVGISMEQVAQFRTLYDKREVPLLTNCRPLRDRGDRSVFHVCPSGTTHATLLSIPRGDTCIHQGDAADNDNNAT